MAISFRVTKIAEGQSDQVEVFGQLVLSGSYKTGGDNISFDYVTPPTVPLSSTPSSFPIYRKTSVLHATRPPINWSPALQGLYIAVLLVGVAATDLRLLIFDIAASAELAAAAYPAGLAGNPFNTLELSYRKNL